VIPFLYIERGVRLRKYTETLRGLREDKDLKQVDIANVLGTTQQHYSKYETGEYELPLRALAALADYYGVSADYIMGRTDCREGVDGLNRKISPEHTVGRLVSDILALDSAGQRAVIEYVGLHKLKEKSSKKA
jgi:transcriptional regulator with XRE-family HTH domain